MSTGWPDSSRCARPQGVGERGQAAVETAIILPLHLFMLLGMLQLIMAHHARLVAEYAAFKTARAGTVYRVNCDHMVRAALMALIPSLDDKGGNIDDPAARYAARARYYGNASTANLNRVGRPLVRVRYRLERNATRYAFDDPLDASEAPMTLRVRLSYYFEYRVPFANWIIVRYWLAMNGVQEVGREVQNEVDPLMPTVKGRAPPITARGDAVDLAAVLDNVRNGFYTAPIVTTWSQRMMSDPPAGFGQVQNGECR